MKKLILIFSALVLILLISFGCSSSDDSSVSTDSGSGTETSFNFTLASLKKQEVASSAIGKQASFTADQVMTGQLTATPSGGGTAQVFDWNIYFNETTWEVQSNKTIILDPGTYDFALLLTKGDQQYAGSVVGQAISDGTFDVPMTIRPIIGNTITDVTLVASLAEFRFQYDAAEFSAASLTNPQMGINTGSGETIYSINPASGISDIWINLDEGANTIQLKLYDGALQVGRSISDQEDILVSGGLNITMDIVALHGETTFALTEDGGDATFGFRIPSDVVDEAGGVANLQVLFQMVGDNNPLVEQTLILIEDASGDYESEVTLSNKQFDNITISLTFTDTSTDPDELLGSCNQLVSLNSTQQTVNCDMTLRRRAIIGGNLLATVGINALNDIGEPIIGARIHGSREGLLGITGSGVYGTSGYLKAFLRSGEVGIKVSSDKLWGGSSIILSPLSVVNQDILVNMPFDYNIELTNDTLHMFTDHEYSPGIYDKRRAVLDTDFATNIAKISADLTVNQYTATGVRSGVRLHIIFKPEGYYGSYLHTTIVAAELRGIESDLMINGWAIQCLDESCFTYDGVSAFDVVGDFPAGTLTSIGATHTASVEYLTGTNTFKIGMDGLYTTLDISSFSYFDPSDTNFGEIYVYVDQVDAPGDIGSSDVTIDNTFIDGVFYDDFSDVNDTLTKWQNWPFR